MIVATSSGYARRGPGLAMRPGRHPPLAALHRRRRDRRGVAVTAQGPAWRIARGERLVRGLVDLLVGRDARLFRDLGLGAGILLGHSATSSIEPSRNLRTHSGTRKVGRPWISG